MIKRCAVFKTALTLFVLGLLGFSAAAQESSNKLIEKIRPAVVALTAYNQKGEVIEQESGFFISPDGRLITSRHLLRGAARAEARTHDGKQYPVKMVIAEDRGADLIKLLIDLKEGEVPFLKMSRTSAIKGEEIKAIGHQHTIQGIVTYVRGREETGKSFQFSTSAPDRATGAPVINKDGAVIGIANQQTVEGKKLGLALASSHALALVAEKSETLAEWNARIKDEPPFGGEALFFAGLNRALTGDASKAIQLLASAVEHNPRDAEAQLYNGYAKTQLGRYDEAIQDYLDALRIAPDYTDVLNNLGALYDKQGRYNEAIDAYSRAIRVRPDYGLAHSNLGAAYHHLGRYREAVEAYKQSLRHSPQSLITYNNLGMAYSMIGLYKESVEALIAATEINPDSTEVLNNLGGVYYKTNRHKKAVESYNRSININPNSAPAYNGLGSAYHKMGRVEEAAAAFRKATELKPDFAEAFSNLGIEYLSMGRLDEAIVALNRATQLRPDFAEAYNSTGLVHTNASRYEEGVRFFKEAIKVKPDFAEAHYNLAVSNLILGNGQGAFIEYGELKKLNQHLASRLFSMIKKKYTVDVAAVSARDENRSDFTERSISHSSIRRLIDQVNTLAAKGNIDRSLADSLIARLQIAGTQRDSGSRIIKINLLNGFIENVSDLIDSEEVPAEAGQVLIDETNKIINQLSD